MPIFRDSLAYESLILHLAQKVSGLEFDRIIGIEARGFLLGPALAMKLKRPFEAMRKKGKLPGELLSIEYDLEYGKDTLQIQKDSLPLGSKCLIIDDLLATGGSLSAAKALVEQSGSQVVGCLVIIELKELKGKQKLGSTPCFELFSY